ncbi:cytochrome C, partial [Thermodesulfobacteriota bacterium]
GPLNDILPLTQKFSVFGMDAQLSGQGKINDYMPRFMGTKKERSALARFIIETLHGKHAAPVKSAIKHLPAKIPAFDEETDDYVLLCWNTSGMHWFSDASPFFMLRPPGNTLYAQLIKRGETPEIVTDEVNLSYEAEPGFSHPSKHIGFWDYTKHYFGKDVSDNVGITGNGLNGTMKPDDEKMAFFADFIPVVPYPDDGVFNPYPLFTITARDGESGNILAQTRAVAPVSTEMGCKNCHGGEFRTKGVAGLSPETAKNILSIHDRISKTDLMDMAKNGKPASCRSCHGDSNSAAKGNQKTLNLSSAMHGFHANYLTDRGSDACHACHPTSPSGNSRLFRGIHNQLDMDCTNCHGKMEDHALSLLMAEKAAGKKSADRLIKHLLPRSVGTKEDITPRIPWINAPDCLHCHEDFEPPETDEIGLHQRTKNKDELFRMRAGDAGVMCTACHGSAHAVYPAINPYGTGRDSIPPLQHQGNPYPLGANKNCKVCHTIDMEEEIHHPNMLTMFRNTQ